MDDHFDIGHVFEIGKFDTAGLTCIYSYFMPVCSIITTSKAVEINR